jgi:hypothetical protein
MNDRWTIKVGEPYERPDGRFAVPVTRKGPYAETQGSCCNVGHDSTTGARQHGAEQEASFKRADLR